MAIWHVAPLRFAPAFRALGVCEHIWLRYKNFDPSCFDPIQNFGMSTWGLTLISDPVPSTYFRSPEMNQSNKKTFLKLLIHVTRNRAKCKVKWNKNLWFMNYSGMARPGPSLTTGRTRLPINILTSADLATASMPKFNSRTRASG